MESNPGNPNPDLTTLWWLILTQYGVIIATIALFTFLLWLVSLFLDRKKKRSSSSAPVSTHYSTDEWFSPEGQKELYRDFNLN